MLYLSALARSSELYNEFAPVGQLLRNFGAIVLWLISISAIYRPRMLVGPGGFAPRFAGAAFDAVLLDAPAFVAGAFLAEAEVVFFAVPALLTAGAFLGGAPFFVGAVVFAAVLADA
jgi:hypothetical protein